MRLSIDCNCHGGGDTRRFPLSSFAPSMACKDLHVTLITGGRHHLFGKSINALTVDCGIGNMFTMVYSSNRHYLCLKKFRKPVFYIAVILCTVFAYVPFSMAEFSSEIDARLIERMQKYLESTKSRSEELSPELRKRLEKQAKSVVHHGLAKFACFSCSSQPRRFSPADTATFFESLRTIAEFHDDFPAKKARIFYERHFHQPSELEVVIRVAFSTPLFRRSSGRLIAHRPFSGSGFGYVGFACLGCCEIVAIPSIPRDDKTWAIFMGGTSFSVLLNRPNPAFFRLSENENLLSGYHPLARTIVLRI